MHRKRGSGLEVDFGDGGGMQKCKDMVFGHVLSAWAGNGKGGVKAGCNEGKLRIQDRIRRLHSEMVSDRKLVKGERCFRQQPPCLSKNISLPPFALSLFGCSSKYIILAR